MNRIDSTSNRLYKQTKKLSTPSGRKKTDLFVIEGERIVTDAVQTGAQVEYIFVSDTYASGESVSFGNIPVYVLGDKLFDTLKSTVNSQGILAVARKEMSSIDDMKTDKGAYLYLDCIMDPGNMGTIIRSANAFGVDGIILSKGCVDVFNPKVLRSTMAGIFSVRLFWDDGSILERLASEGFDIIGTFPEGKQTPRELEFSGKSVIVMGNEANGICDEVKKFCTKKVTIPMTNLAESLNVSVACGIMLYEAFIASRK